MKSLQSKMGFYFTLFPMIMGIILGIIIYYISERLVISSIQTQITQITKAANNKINVKEFEIVVKELKESIENKKDVEKVMQMDEFTHIQFLLSEFRITHGMKYAYTFTKLENDEFIYVIDGFDNLNIDEASKPGDVEMGFSSEYEKIYKKRDIVVSDLVTSKEWGSTLTAYEPIIDSKGEIIGVLGIDMEGEHVHQLLKKSKIIIALSTIILVIISTIIGRIYGKNMINPLIILTKQIQSAEEGKADLSFNIKRNDEIGVVANSFKKLMKKLSLFLKVNQEQSNKLKETVQLLEKETTKTIYITDESSNKLQALNGEIIEQLENIEKTVGVMDKINNDINEITNKTNEAKSLSELVNLTAGEGKGLLEKTILKIDEVKKNQIEYERVVAILEKKTSEINHIIETIGNVSNQINLLALNASIEAARAGEHGKGFRVVAEEVKSLADETSFAVKGISSLIININESVDLTVKRMTLSNEKIHETSNDIEKSGNLFSSISKYISEMNQQINDIHKNTEKLNEESSSAMQRIYETEKKSQLTHRELKDFNEVFDEQLKSIQSIQKETVLLQKTANVLHESIEKLSI